MYSYPYTMQGVSQALKEICNSESPVVPESFCMISAQGELGGKSEGTYEFKTEDGCKYKITAEGYQMLIPYELPSLHMLHIKLIQKI